MTDGAVIRPFDPVADAAWAIGLLDLELAGRHQARRGELVDALEGGEGLVAEQGGERAGLLTWFRDPATGDAEVRLLVIDAATRRRGIGRSLLRAAEAALADLGCRRAWLVTTNDNLDALAFYQALGWRLAALHPGAVDEARRTLKPSIGRIGAFGIPIRDELELERRLDDPDEPPGVPGRLG